MANHKLTFLGDPASKKIQTYLQRQDNDLFGSLRRLAYADGVMAISGQPGVELASELYKVDLTSHALLHSFRAMIHGHGFEQAERREAEVCTEARLWMTLAALHLQCIGQGHAPRHRHLHPRHLHVWVYEVDSKNRPKEDSPCKNCRQWVRKEFRSVNGT
jgi:hypothetical protein